MKLKQICVSIENAVGRLREVTQSLGEAGINLRALNLVDTGGFGLLRLLVSDVATTRRILMEKHIPARVEEVVAVEIDDKPGSLSKVLKLLNDGGVFVVYMYAFAVIKSGMAVMVFRFSDNDSAIEILKKNEIKLFNAESLGMLEGGG